MSDIPAVPRGDAMRTPMIAHFEDMTPEEQDSLIRRILDRWEPARVPNHHQTSGQMLCELRDQKISSACFKEALKAAGFTLFNPSDDPCWVYARMSEAELRRRGQANREREREQVSDR
jgi:hypothetical protein